MTEEVVMTAEVAEEVAIVVVVVAVEENKPFN
jgi:hypothetical protein